MKELVVSSSQNIPYMDGCGNGIHFVVKQSCSSPDREVSVKWTRIMKYPSPTYKLLPEEFGWSPKMVAW